MTEFNMKFFYGGMMSQTATAFIPINEGFVHSETIGKVTAALLKAQKAIGVIAKDSKNPHFGNEYASLEAILAVVKPALDAVGVLLIQTPAPSDGSVLNLTTALIHESGEYYAGTCTMPLGKADPQGYGGAITYAKRYGIVAILGLATEADDDGEAAVGRSSFPKREGESNGAAFPGKAAAPKRGKTSLFPSVRKAK